jgi:4-alpha-glucanotransferase
MYQRSSGLLMHITSLPGPHGIGDLGEEARQFVRLLEASGQHLWQVLPLGPAGAGNSPYDSRSSFAGNPMMISLNDLTRDGLLDEKDVPSQTRFSQSKVEFGRVMPWKERRLRTAHKHFLEGRGAELQDDYEQFVSEARDWLEDFTLYQAIRLTHKGQPWYEWDEELRLGHPEALSPWRSRLSEEIAYQRFVQFIFDRQWKRLKRYAADHEVTIMGDIPIYVALDSAEVWANQDQFLINEHGRQQVQAGVPPDLFSRTGQLWGNPIYDWEKMSDDGYTWWRRRIERTLSMTDIVRIDHFRGFAAGWQVPAGAPNAINGEWVLGPGMDFFRVIERQIGRIPIIVEDLGLITPDVEELRDNLGYPGMKVLQFAFGDDAKNPYLPHNGIPNSMIYTGTHDNDTTVEWYASQPEETRRHLRRYARASSSTIHWDMLRLAWSTVSVLACAPIQDVLGLGGEARMNRPGRARGNWGWRLTDYAGLQRRAANLRELTELYGRDNTPLKPELEVEAQDDRRKADEAYETGVA